MEYFLVYRATEELLGQKESKESQGFRAVLVPEGHLVPRVPKAMQELLVFLAILENKGHRASRESPAGLATTAKRVIRGRQAIQESEERLGFRELQDDRYIKASHSKGSHINVYNFNRREQSVHPGSKEMLVPLASRVIPVRQVQLVQTALLAIRVQLVLKVQWVFEAPLDLLATSALPAIQANPVLTASPATSAPEV